MENEQKICEPEQEGYQPRPKWQVWGARIVLVIFIAFLILYYRNFFLGGM